MKTCTHCRVEKELSEFRKNSCYADGHVTWCASCAKAYRAKHYLDNKEKVRAQNAVWHAANKEKMDAQNAAWYAANKERHCESIARARAAKPEQYRAMGQAYHKRWLEKPANRLRSRLSSQITYCLKTGKGGRTTASILGYSIADLHAHLESLFVDGMGWHNMGAWHIDHMRPLASFTITGPDDPMVRVAWALNNLQPLWARDNIVKGARWDGNAARRAA